MEKDLGYQELLLLANRLQDRVNALAKEADEAQAEGILAYTIAQSNSLEQARFAYETAHNDLIVGAKEILAKEILAATDGKAAEEVLNAYGKYGIKEI